MSRELNPELFPEMIKKAAQRPVSTTDEGTLAPIRSEEWRILVGQVDFLKRKLKEFDARIETTNSRLNEFASATKLKFERINSSNQRLDEMIKNTLQDLNTKQSQIISRVNERKVGDAKIQDLVDRHNQLVLSFEVRLNQMQKLVSEQEMHLMSSREELKEAQREIARLKRV